MSAAQRLSVDPLVHALLSDMRLAPRQFVETFLEQEDLDGVVVSYLHYLDEAELDLFAMRWATHGRAARHVNPIRFLPSGRTDTATLVLRPHYLDESSVTEMMRGMFHE